MGKATLEWRSHAQSVGTRTPSNQREADEQRRGQEVQSKIGESRELEDLDARYSESCPRILTVS